MEQTLEFDEEEMDNENMALEENYENSPEEVSEAEEEMEEIFRKSKVSLTDSETPEQTFNVDESLVNDENLYAGITASKSSLVGSKTSLVAPNRSLASSKRSLVVERLASEEPANLGAKGVKEMSVDVESTMSLSESIHSMSTVKGEEHVATKETEAQVIYDDVRVKFRMIDDIERAIELKLNPGLTVKQALETLANLVHKDVEDMKVYKYHTKEKMHKRDILFKYIKNGQDPLICNVHFTYDDSSDESAIMSEEYEPDMKVQKVQILRKDGTKKYLEILIHNVAFTKEWCGGYRNKQSGTVYHNAWSQTNPLERGSGLPPGVRPPDFYTRETQTHLPYINTSMNTPYDRSTQMWRRDYYIPSVNDKIVQAQTYTPIDEIRKILTPHQAVLILQRFFRTYLAKSKIRKAVILASEQNKAKANLKGVLNEEIHKDRMSLLIKEIFPLSRGDFYDLYTILGIWKQEELQKIKETTDGISQKAAIADLFEKEVECLFNIERQRIRSKNESLYKSNIRVLQNSARCIVKRYPKGNLTITDTLATQRAREFKEIYSAYRNFDTTKQERIDVLTTLKHMLSKLEGIDVTKDIIELINRECDLVILNIPNDKLVGLRKRIETMFFNMIKSPEFNSQVLRLKKPNESKLKQPLYKCKGCGKVKTPGYFFSHLRLPSFHFCMSCSWMNTTANATINLAPYTRLLNMLRASETMKCCRSSVVFLLQPMGMYYIMNVIWQGQSAISGSSYLPELRMTRWNKCEEWAPWNTILLTEAEASVHDALENLETFYTRWFILKVKNKHILARMHFSKVYYTDLELRESGKWTSVKDEGFYTNPRHTQNLDKDLTNDFFKLPKGLMDFKDDKGETKMVDAGC